MDSITLAAGFGSTAGIQTFLLTGLLPVVIIAIALILIMSARKKDFSSAATVIGIVVLGCLVLALSVPGVAVSIGTAISNLVFA
jgi:hypothetical protein